MIVWIVTPRPRHLAIFHLILIAMMASSQVEIATTSSPFACRDQCFRRNLNNLVIPNASPHQIDCTDLWVHCPQWEQQHQNNTTTTSNNNDNKNNEEDVDNINGSIGIMDVEAQPHHHKDKWGRTRQMVFAVDKGGCASSEASNGARNIGGVFSLVQRWKGFEAEAKCSSSTRSNLEAGTTTGSPTALQYVPAPATNDEVSLGNSESNRIGPYPVSGDSDKATAERERLRVADIIRKLTDDRSGGVDCESPSLRVRISSSDQSSEQKCFSPVACSPRIRGRQAYNDLLVQMERDRHKELEGLVTRKAVSKFSHRGRIQALLRFRFLRRGMDSEERLHSSLSPKLTQHFRERVYPCSPNGSVHSGSFEKQHKSNTPAATNHLNVGNQWGKENQHQVATCSAVETDHSQDATESSVASKDHDGHPCSHQVNENMHHNTLLLHNFVPSHCAKSPLSTCMGQEETSFESINHSHSTEIEMCTKDEEVTSNQQVVATNYDLTDDYGDYQQLYHEGESPSNHDLMGNDEEYWTTNVSHPEVGWEDLQSDDYEEQEEGISNRDWIDEVSRPRSDWEDLRQARYQEMLDPFQDNNQDIRDLLGRRSVSKFLSSGLREQIDRLMISRAQGQQSRKKNRILVEEEEEEEIIGVPEEEDRVENKQEVTFEDEQLDENKGDLDDYFEEEYEEAESSMEQLIQYNECDVYDDKIASSPLPSPPLPPTSWPLQGQCNHQRSDYSSQVVSPSTQLSMSSNGPNSSYNIRHPAIEMELVYDLRGHMEQLRQEISELRKSINSCMNMQIKLQRSIKKEVDTVLNHPAAGKKDGRQKSVKVTSGGRCRVCCKMRVDSLLYRCGHMCTCFKCAHELQWGGGKCPICGAPIMDVVRIQSELTP